MAQIQAYVLVSTDGADKTIYGGPLAYDGQAVYSPGPGRQLMLLTDATTAGYAFPAPPVTQVNTQTLQSLATQALAANQTYLGLASPTNAQVAAQVKLLTRECSALIRLLLNQTDTTDGT